VAVESAFVSRYDEGHICNSSDDSGRYAYGKQPWAVIENLQKLGEMISLAGADSHEVSRVRLMSLEWLERFQLLGTSSLTHACTLKNAMTCHAHCRYGAKLSSSEYFILDSSFTCAPLMSELFLLLYRSRSSKQGRGIL
jgi:uncharacterized protein YdiU (UPF0061 family)